MRRIEIYDTTLRDGAQGEGVSFSAYDKLLLTRRLNELGFDYIEGGYPASNDKDFEYFQKVAQIPLDRSTVVAFGMTRRKGLDVAQDSGIKSLLEAGTKVVTIVGKASAFQAEQVLRTTREENLAMITDTISYIRSQGREVIFDAEHFFDGYKYDSDYALTAVRLAAEAGAKMVVLCDTNGGSMPEEVAEITRKVVELLPVPVGIHCHNDCDVAVANSLAAVDAGASQVQGTINGFGERCGNADLISVIANLRLKKGYEVLTPDALRHLTALSRFVYEMVNMPYRNNQPYVGRSAFAHKGGMHVSGVSRVPQSYEHIDPQLVGNERRILVSELSGRSNIMAATAKLNIQADPKLLERILAKVVAREHAGYQYEAAQGSFDLLVKQCLGTFKPHFERLAYRVNIETESDGRIVTEATVKIRVGNEIRHEVAEGDGPVNALDAAMRKALNGTFPNLAKMHLVDYKVRVINSEAGTAAGVRVMIESRDETDSWGTVGVSENIIEASWIALADSYEYKLCKDEEREQQAREKVENVGASRER
ncbi:(R)-citramalate synthase [Thermogutta terrifontis]|jgi:2-isopropylmalate synthase|uniref:Citramalate synthase n=1 Tax=Thermogutta terrifontis TaxID=1331910 RepID=A0A286RJ89_9BACT|nr:citramalate synthase [Thermogutta terrifontis]ASV76023.1 (R)-citramalate synthase [Thermogutta terrifontis]